MTRTLKAEKISKNSWNIFLVFEIKACKSILYKKNYSLFYWWNATQLSIDWHWNRIQNFWRKLYFQFLLKEKEIIFLVWGLKLQVWNLLYLCHHLRDWKYTLQASSMLIQSVIVSWLWELLLKSKIQWLYLLIRHKVNEFIVNTNIISELIIISFLFFLKLNLELSNYIYIFEKTFYKLRVVWTTTVKKNKILSFNS